MPDSKNTFTPNSSSQNDFFKKIGWYTFFLLYLWAKYELRWSDISAQTVTLGAKILKNTKSNPRNPKCGQFFWIKMTAGSITFIEKSGDKI